MKASKLGIQKSLAFLKRDFTVTASYRFFFALQFIGIFLWILVFYFIAKLFGEAAAPFLAPYGGDYFSFVLIGIAFSNYLSMGLNTFSGSIRNEQMTGTLEVMLVTPTNLSTIIISSSIWSFIFTSIRVIIYLILGVFLFGIDISGANVLASLIILFLTIISFSSLGIISAAFIIVLKRGDPITWLFNAVSQVFGGVYYPITILPKWLQIVSYILPITYSLRGMRLAILQGLPFEALVIDMLALLLFSIVLLPISIILFRYAVKISKRDGTLAHY
jgi:ABC-2 type transport system permease protein